MGLIHGRDRLCLVQICNEFKRTSCIKIELNTSSSPHLKSLLEDDKITKIFHYETLFAYGSSNPGKTEIIL